LPRVRFKPQDVLERRLGSLDPRRQHRLLRQERGEEEPWVRDRLEDAVVPGEGAVRRRYLRDMSLPVDTGRGQRLRDVGSDRRVIPLPGVAMRPHPAVAACRTKHLSSHHHLPKKAGYLRSDWYQRGRAPWWRRA